MHTPHYVVAKAAIFDSTKKHVLVIHIPEDRSKDYGRSYGLPGGHIEPGEAIDTTIERELYEECGIRDISLTKTTFFTHENGKIVLAYVGRYDKDLNLVSQQDVSEGKPTWVTKQRFEGLKIDPNYKAFVLENWK